MFNLTEKKCTEEQLNALKAAIPFEAKENERVISVLSFDKRTKRWGRPGMKGDLVITAPHGRIHVFSGIDRSYQGFADYLAGYGGMWMDPKLADFMETQRDSSVSEFVEFMQEIRNAVVKAAQIHQSNTSGE